MRMWLSQGERPKLSGDNLLPGRRLFLRPLAEKDYESWAEIRLRCGEWLTKWEPRHEHGSHIEVSFPSFKNRVQALLRDREFGNSFCYGIFLPDRLIGEVNLVGIARSVFAGGSIGYWIDKAFAGKGYMPEAVAVLLKFGFEVLQLHRIEVSIVPRNQASLRVAEKLNFYFEGIAREYLKIDGIWEDHKKFSILDKDWVQRRQFYYETFLNPPLF